MRTADTNSKLWRAVFNINELTLSLERISSDDKRPLESYSAKEIVAEAEYVLSTFFEPGHINGDAFSGEFEDGEFGQVWARGEVRKLKALIKRFKTS